MSNIENDSAADDEKKKARDELIVLIDEFLKLSEFKEEQNIIEWVYYLFEPYGTNGLSSYQDAAAVGLAITSDAKLSKQMEDLYGNDFSVLCAMLHKIVEFCNRIKDNETNMARLDKCKVEVGDWHRLTMKDILKGKIKYTHKIQCLKEITALEKRAK